MIKYITQKGDTLWDIAEKYLGSGSRWKEIEGYSGAPEKLPVGTILSIPTEEKLPEITPKPETTPKLISETERLKEIERLNKKIEETQKKLEEARFLYEKAKAGEIKEGEEIPKEIEEAETIEEAKIKGLEKEVFAFEWETPEIKQKKAEIMKVKEDYEKAAAEINENPWLSETGRVGRIRRLYEMAEMKMRRLADEYKTMQEGKEREWEMKKAYLDYLMRSGKGNEYLTITEAEKLGLPYGTTRAEAMKMKIIPKKMEKDWTEFSDQEKRKLMAAKIDWTTPEGFTKGLEYLYPSPEKEWREFTPQEKRRLEAAGIDWTTSEGRKKAVKYLYPEEIEKEERKKINIAISSMTRELSKVIGRDGYVSPESWKKAKKAWVNEGLDPEKFIKQFYIYINPGHPEDYGLREAKYITGEYPLY